MDERKNKGNIKGIQIYKKIVMGQIEPEDS